MRILLFGDIHEDLSRLPEMADDLRGADLVILHGDLTNNGGGDRARAVVEKVRGYCRQVLAQPGNMDRDAAARYLVEEGISLHGRGYRFDRVGVFGVGGSNRTPFGTPTEYTEEELEAAMRRALDDVRDAPVKLLVSHAPPHETALDVVGGGAHVGSVSVREFILRERPAICVSGHIHEARGEDRLGETRLFNTGAFGRGGYVEVTVDEDGLAAELRILGRNRGDE
jgi:Icc-related predicted phosphoesterase